MRLNHTEKKMTFKKVTVADLGDIEVLYEEVMRNAPVPGRSALPSITLPPVKTCICLVEDNHNDI